MEAQASGLTAPKPYYEELMQQARILEKDKRNGDLKLKQCFVRRVAEAGIAILWKNATHRSISHDNYFDYFFPNGKGKYVKLSIDCAGFSYGADLDRDAKKVEEMQGTSRWACYQFLCNRGGEELARRNVFFALIEPSIQSHQESPLVRTAVLSVMRFIEEQEKKLSLTYKSKPMLENEALWEASDSWEPLSDKWGPAPYGEVDTHLDDLLEEENKIIREHLLSRVIVEITKEITNAPGYRGEGVKSALLKFHNDVEASPIKFSGNGPKPIPVKLVCYNYLLSRACGVLEDNNINLHRMRQTLEVDRFIPNYYRIQVIKVMEGI